MKRLLLLLCVAGAALAATTPPGTTIPGSLALTGVLAPSAITTNANNYAPAGLASVSRINISATVPLNLTGLTGMVDGRELQLCNVGAQTITLKANSSSSTSGNRFIIPADFALLANAAILLRGDGTVNGWRAIGDAVAGTGTVTAVTASSPLSATAGTAPNITLGTVPITSGGTGQTGQQQAMNALAGGVTSGRYLRGNGVNTLLAAIQAADVPTLNQDTTGAAALASQVDVANDLGNVTAYPAWVVGTGNDNLYVSTSKLSFHPSTGVLTAAGFAGPLTGAVTGNVTGNLTGNASTATTAATCSGNAATVTGGVYVTGNQTIAGTKTFSNKITGNITGNADGNAATATTASACTGNAATVTGGVYTSGNQTIGGTKTFSATIGGSINGNAATATTATTATTAGTCTGNAATVTGGVYTSGNQTVAGTKTFSGPFRLASQSVPMGSAGTGTLYADLAGKLASLSGVTSNGNVVSTADAQTITGTKTFSKLNAATGAAAITGTATVNGVTGRIVSTTAVTAASIIMVSYCTPKAGATGLISAPVASIIAGTSFVIFSTNATDTTSTVCWWILN